MPDLSDDSGQVGRLSLEGRRLICDGKPLSAARTYLQALEYCPDSGPQRGVILGAISFCHSVIGNISGALDYAHRAHRADPVSPILQSNLLMTLLYLPDADPGEIFATCRQWGEQFPPAAAPARIAHERVRVGYLGSGYCIDPEVCFTEPLLQGHDSSKFEVFCYSIGDRSDEWTTRLQQKVAHWRDLSQVTPAEGAAIIRRDEIEILVDCSGHFSGGRHRLLAWKPAPVQVGLSLYPATTGLPTMDYRITDSDADPVGLTEHLYTEKLVRLPTRFCCYRPPDGAPEVGPLPAARNGYVTFGSFNRFDKINPLVIDLWAALLRKLPDSELFFHHVFSGCREAPLEYCQGIVQAFYNRGIDCRRLNFTGQRPITEHLALFHEVDISLDPFPYNGMTTTCESLWMGVPVVTLAGRAHVGRVGVSYLKAAGLTDWIAETPEEYLRIAVAKAADLDVLAETRANLRPAMRGCPLTDQAAYVNALEAAYLHMITVEG